jgi:hypothetical protein
MTKAVLWDDQVQVQIVEAQASGPLNSKLGYGRMLGTASAWQKRYGAGFCFRPKIGAW